MVFQFLFSFKRKNVKEVPITLALNVLHPHFKIEFIVCFCYYINSILIDKKTKMVLFKSVLLS